VQKFSNHSKPKKYNRELALYSEDSLGFVKGTQDEQWQKFCGLYSNEPETKFLEHVGVQLGIKRVRVL
jgi:type I restriction enzyme R subunit